MHGRFSSHSATPRLALDRESVRRIDRDGRLHVEITNISKACVNPYKGSEIPDYERLGLDAGKIYNLLRDPEELARSAATFNNLPLLSKHIPVMAPDYDSQAKKFVIGSSGTDATFERPYLRNSMVVWSGPSIEDIDSDDQKEISCGYHYKPDMTPGVFEGEPYDGVMREIVGNHIALVKDGRAGPDVVVGDSNEEIESMTNEALARKIKAVAARTVTVGALCSYLRPRLAMDAKLDLAKVLSPVPGKQFKAKKAEIAAGIREQAKGKMAKDASLDDVEKVLDLLEKHEVDEGEDESTSEEQHKAMEAAAHGESNLGIPKKVGEEFAEKDKGKGKAFDAEPMRAFLKKKGMGDEDIEAAMDLMPKDMPKAADESEEEKKKREEEEKAKREKEAKDRKTAKDAEMKDMVTKPAMDQAIATATKAVRETERGIRKAIQDVRPYVGELSESLAFDSAADVYRHVLVMKGVEGADKLHDSALKTVLDLLPKAGARPTTPAMGMDSAASKGFAERFPDAKRIGSA